MFRKPIKLIFNSIRIANKSKNSILEKRSFPNNIKNNANPIGKALINNDKKTFSTTTNNTTARIMTTLHAFTNGVESTPTNHKNNQTRNFDEPTLKLETHTDHLTIKWEDGTSSELLYHWLRDNCRCSECFHPVTQQRLFDSANVRSL